MKFQDNLAELDVSTKLFRENVKGGCESPVKLKARELYNRDFSIREPKMIIFDEDHHSPYQPKKLFKLKVFKKNLSVEASDKEIKLVSYKSDFNGCEEEQSEKEKETKEPVPKPVEAVKESIAEPVEKKKEIVKKPPKTENHVEKQSKKTEAVGQNDKKRKKSAEELSNQKTFASRYNKYVEDRKQNKNPKKIAKKKHGPFKEIIKPQLRNKIVKVATYWQRRNIFIPSVFHLFKLESRKKRAVFEFQDFSLKGLAHDREDGRNASRGRTESRISQDDIPLRLMEQTLNHDNINV